MLDGRTPLSTLAAGDYELVAGIAEDLIDPRSPEPMSLDIARVPVSGTWVRHVPAGGEALRTGKRGTPGRFHRPGEIALYLAARSRPTAWAEWYRALAERAQEPNEDVPRDLFRVSVNLSEVVDVSTTAARARAGLPSNGLAVRKLTTAEKVAHTERTGEPAFPPRSPQIRSSYSAHHTVWSWGLLAAT
jgi:hypothetical protein